MASARVEAEALLRLGVALARIAPDRDGGEVARDALRLQLAARRCRAAAEAGLGRPVSRRVEVTAAREARAVRMIAERYGLSVADDGALGGLRLLAPPDAPAARAFRNSWGGGWRLGV